MTNLAFPWQVDKKQRLAAASYDRRQICLVTLQEKALYQQLSTKTAMNNQEYWHLPEPFVGSSIPSVRRFTC